ncbi:hypothetical protein GCM10009123_05250 [Kangiella japonica]|uniref:Uncharacterized protein n=1 Tax=Kangiella japonica TaxID=647384 RepID=A0ABP3CE66_9GAMM
MKSDSDYEKVMKIAEEGGGFLDSLMKLSEVQSERSESIARQNLQTYENNSDEFVRLTESFFKKDTLMVMTEALPLLHGIYPPDWQSLQKEYYSGEILELIEADRYASLKVINGYKRKGLWRVNTKEFFKWADTKGLLKAKGLIEALKNTKGLSKPKGKNNTNKPHKNAENNALAREVLYKAAISALISYPDDCKYGKNFSASSVAKVIEENSIQWWPDGNIPFEPETIKRLLREAMKNIQ